MIYENIELEMIKFLDNPFDQVQFVERNKNENVRKNFSKYLTIFRKKSNLEKFEVFLIDKLQTAQTEINLLHPQVRTSKPGNFHEILIKKLKDFISIRTHFSTQDEYNYYGRSVVENFWLEQLLTKFEYHVNRLSEHSNLGEEYLLPLIENKNIWVSFYLSEIYFFCKNGLLDVSYKKGSFKFFLANGVEETHIKPYWLTEVLESLSQKSDQKMLYEFAKAIHIANPEYVANELVLQVLDKVFSIKEQFLDESTLESEKFKCMKEYICLYSVLAGFCLSGVNKVRLQYFFDNKLIRHSTASFVQKYLGQLDAKFNGVYSSIKFIGNEVELGNLEFKVGIRHFVGGLLNSKQRELKGTDFPGLLGDIFDKNYVFNYLSGLKNKDWTLYTDFKAGTGADVKGYDVDIVIKDNLTLKFYFIQVKYLLSALPRFLVERINTLRRNPLKKGFDPQLLSLKNSFNEPSVQEKLRNNGLGDATLDNSHFILLHNLPFLSFYESQGVLFYEWNLLRNILQDGKIYWVNDKDSGVTSSSDNFELHESKKIMNSYFTEQNHRGALSKQFKLYQSSTISIKYDDINIECPLL